MRLRSCFALLLCITSCANGRDADKPPPGGSAGFIAQVGDYPIEMADLEQAVADGTVIDIYGIGKGLAGVINELVTTGRSARYDEICLKYRETLFDLFKVSGLGTSKIKKLNQQLGVDSLDNLEAAAKAGHSGKYWPTGLWNVRR